VTLTWNNTAVNADYLLVERALDSGFTTGLVQASLASNTTSYSDTTAATGVIYYYRITAVNTILGCCRSSAASGCVIGLVVPATPTCLAASVYVSQATANTANTAAKVELTWINGGTNQTGLTLLRATDANFTANVTTINPSNSANSYTDTDVTAGTTYYYKMLASNGSACSAYSTAITVAVSSANAPASFAATPGNLSGIQASVILSWTISANPTLSWTLQRSTDPLFQTGVTEHPTTGLIGKPITAASRNTTENSVNGIASKTTYYYRLRATYSNGTSSAWLKSTPTAITTK
jgi:fibronectin type 3 domain-containing protein